MRCARVVCLASLAGALALAGAAPAGAEPPLELAQGSQPTAVTDAAGTLHVVFRQFQVPAALMYCRVPAGGGPCTPVQIARDAGTPYLQLRPQDGVLIAVFPSVDATLDQVTSIAASGDGGTTWTGQAPVGVGMHGISDAQLSPDGAFVVCEPMGAMGWFAPA